MAAIQRFLAFPAKVQPIDASHSDVRSKVRVNETADRLVIYGLLAFGLFIPKHFTNVGGSKWVIFAIYYAFVFAALAANTLRVVITVRDSSDDFNALTFVKIALTLWMVVSVANYGFAAFACLRRRTGIARYYEQLSEAKESLKSLNAGHNKASNVDISSAVTVGTAVFGWTVTLVPACISIYQLWNPEVRKTYDTFLKFRIGNYSLTPPELYPAGNVLQGFAFVFGIGAFMWPALYKLIVSLQLACLLRCFRQCVKKGTTFDTTAFMIEVSRYRESLRRIRKIVRTVNSCFGASTMLDLLFHLFCSMITFYVALWPGTFSESAPFFGMFCVFAALLIGVLIAETLAAASVATASEDCVKSLAALKSASLNVSVGSAIEINLLFGEMQTPMGIEPLGIFMINKEAVVAIVSTWLTYFLVILSFNPKTSQ